MPSFIYPVMPEMPARELGADAQPAHMLCSCLRYHWPIVQCCRCTMLSTILAAGSAANLQEESNKAQRLAMKKLHWYAGVGLCK